MPYFSAIRQDEYPATDETQCIPVYIPAGDEYKAILAAFVAMLSDPFSYEDPYSAQAEGIAATFDQGYSEIDWYGCPPPESLGMQTQVLLFPINMTVASGNTILNTIDSAQRLNGYQAQSPAVVNQALDSHTWLASGIYSYALTCVKQSGSGILSLFMDDADNTNILNVNHDFYSAGTTRNFRFTGTVTVPVPGDTRIYWETASKHASSSGYAQLVTCLELWKTADV